MIAVGLLMIVAGVGFSVATVVGVANAPRTAPDIAVVALVALISAALIFFGWDLALGGLS
jgi:hypothetical protein